MWENKELSKRKTGSFINSERFTEQAQAAFTAISQPNTFSWNMLLTAYAQNGHLQQAKTTFDRMPERDISSWNTMLSAYVRVNEIEMAAKLFQRMPQKDTVSLKTLTVAFAQNGDLTEAKSLFDETQEKDVYTCTALITAYAKEGNIQQSRDIFEEMPERDVICWNAMLAANAQNGDLAEVESLFVNMPFPDIVSFTTLLTAYAQQGELSEAKSVFLRIPQRNLVTYTALLAAYARHGETEQAEYVFNCMPEWNLSSTNALLQSLGSERVSKFFEEMPVRDIVSWNTLLRARFEEDVFVWGMPEHDIVSCSIAIMGYARNGYICDARNIFDGMPCWDVVCWNSMISAFAQSGHFCEAKELFDSLDWKEISTWNAMISGFIQQDRLEEAKLLFDDMPVWNAVSWSALLTGYVQKGHMDYARRMLGGLPFRHPGPYNAVISGYALVGDAVEAVRVSDTMKEKDIPQDTATFLGLVGACCLGGIRHVERDVLTRTETCVRNALIDMYGRQGAVASAEAVFRRVPRADTVTYTAMISAYTQNGCIQLALELMFHMEMEGIEFDEVAFVSILTTCSHGGLLKQARRCFLCMVEDHGITPRLEHYNCLLDLFGRVGYIIEGNELLQHMPYLPGHSSLTTLYSSCKLAQSCVSRKSLLSNITVCV